MQLGTSLASATSLTFTSGSQAIGDSVSASAPLDQYRFSLNAPSTLRASLNSTSQSVVATITLVHDKNLNQIVDANEVLTSQSTSLVAAELQVQTLDAGTYYLIVSAANPSQSLDYTLQAASTPEVDTDILWRDPVTQELGYWRFDGTTFIGTQRLQYGFSTSWLTGWEIIGIGDFNGDRLDDLAWRSSYSGEVGVWLMGREASGQRLLAGGGVFAGMTVTSDWQLSGIGDLDGDGKADWIWRNPSQGGVGYWLIDGDKVRQTGSFNGTIGAEWVLEGVGDFDGDRKTDLFWRNRNTLQTATWLMNGFTITTGTVLQQQMALNLRVEGFGDFSGDGKTDILLRDTSSGNVSAWLVNNNQIQQSSLLLSNNSIINVPGNWQVVGIDDFTSDRKADIIWRNSTTGEVAIWAIDGLRITQTELLTDPSLRNLNWKVIGTTTRPVMADLPPVETTPPVVQLSLESDTGVLGDRITRLTTIVGRITDQSGLAEVTASLNNLSFINILSWIDANGTIRLDRSRLETILGSVLTDRSYQLVIRAKDRFGNWTNTSSNPLSWTLDTTAPTVSLDLSDSSDTGRSTTDNLTRNRTLQFQGTVGAGAQVQLWLNDLQLNPTITNGTWQITTPTLTGNTYQVKAVATDIAGNTQEVVLSPGLVIDTVAPTAPTGLQIVANSSGAANRRTIAGNAEANTIILLYANGNLVGETLTATDGKWQVETSALPDSDYILIAKAIDAAGNESSLSTSLTFTIASQLSAPGNIRLTSQSDSGLSNADNITKLNKPSVTGTALAGTTVKLYQNNQLLGQAIADSSGTWTITPTTALPSGTHTLRATASSGSLESASTAFNLTIDAVQPAVKLQQFNNGQLATMVDGAILTANSRFVGSIDGTGSNFAWLAYQLGNQSEVVINVAEDGLFNQMIDLGSIVPGTTTLQVTATDAAGNEYSKTYAVNISQGAIVAEPPKLIINLIQDTGRSASDGWTTAPGISGFVTQSGFNVLEAQIIQSTSASSTPLFSGFVNISSSFNQNSTFMLDEQQLAGLLNTTTLDDGNYTVQLRAFAGEVKLEQSFFFNLDRTTPVTEVSNLIDGIGWERGTFFEGTIEDLSDNVQFEYWFENAEGVGIGGGGSSLIEGGGFQQTPPEFGIDNEFLEDETAYNLVILSTDLAGNQHRSRFEFFLLGDRTVVDDDTWNKSDPERDNPPPSDPNTPPGNIGPDGELGSRGAFTIGASWTSSEYQSLGWYHRQSDLGGGGTNPPTLIGQGYEYEYRESVYEMTKAAVDRISTHPQTVAKKAALDNRIEILNQIAQRIENLINADGDFKNDRAFINLLAPVMEGLFVDAYDPSAEKAGVWENYVPIGGLWLASDLVKDPRSVRVQVFQATLLSVVTEVLKNRAMVAGSVEHQKLVNAVMELGATYAWLNPDSEANVSIEDKDFAFLNQLWRLQVLNGQGGFADGSTIAQTLQFSVEALERLLSNVDDPVKTILFINNLFQSATKARTLKTGTTPDIGKPGLLRELVEFGFEIAETNPKNLSGNSSQLQDWLGILWEDGQANQLADHGVSRFFDQPGTLDDRVQRLKYSTELLKAVQKVDDPTTKRIIKSSVHLSYLLDLSSSHAALNPNNNRTLNEASFLMLVAQGDLQGASNELERVIQDALGSMQYDQEVFVISSGGKIKVGDGAWVNDHTETPIFFNASDSDPTNDRYSIAYRVRRANGTIEAPVAGDTRFRLYLQTGDRTGLQPGETPLYVGDSLLYPSDNSDPLGKDRLRSLVEQSYSPAEKTLDALRLAPFVALPQVKQQIEGFVNLVKDHPIITSAAVGGFVGAQFVQPIGVILDVGLILLGGWQLGFSLGSFIYKAATAQSQAQLLDAAREVTNVVENLLTIGTPSGLLKLDSSLGLLNTTRILDAGMRILREIKNFRVLERTLTLSDALSIPFRLFSDDTTAIGKLLQYGAAGVTDFLKGGFDKFTGGLPTLEGLRDFADRFKRVASLAENLNAPAKAQHILQIIPSLSQNQGLVKSILQDPVLEALLTRGDGIPMGDTSQLLGRLSNALQRRPFVPEIIVKGEKFGQGNVSSVFNVVGHSGLLLKPSGRAATARLVREAEAMLQMEMLDIPTVYTRTSLYAGETVLILEKVPGKSVRDIIGTPGQPLNPPQYTNLITQKTIDDLERIYGILMRENVDVGDFQFIIRESDGGVIVNDPSGLIFNRQPNLSIERTINSLREILRSRS